MSMAARVFQEPLYCRPSSIAEAAALLADHGSGARLLAGGQTLIPEIDRPDAAIAVIIDLGAVAELTAIRWLDRHVEIGAMVTIAEARRHLLPVFPTIDACFSRVGNSAVRNRATLGGSVALADAASEITAFLLAYDAELLLADGRVVSLAAFPVGARPEGFLIQAIRIPRPSPGERGGFAEILRRRSGGRSLAMALARLGPNDATLVFSGGEHQPFRVYGADGSALLTKADERIAGLAPATRAWIAAAVRRAIVDAERPSC